MRNQGPPMDIGAIQRVLPFSWGLPAWYAMHMKAAVVSVTSALILRLHRVCA